MPDELEGVGQAETGWIAFFMTFGGAALGPLAAIVVTLYVADQSPDAKELILSIPWPVLLFVVAASFVVGAYAGNWLGKMIGKWVYILTKKQKPADPEPKRTSFP